MLPVAFALLLLGLVSSLDGLNSFYTERSAALYEKRYQGYATTVMEAIELHRDIYRFFPANLNDLADTKGFEHLRPVLDALSGRIHYVHAGQRRSGDGEASRDPWSLETIRIGFTLNDVERSSSDYFSAANNACGTEPADTAQDWCGEFGSLWAQMQNDKDLFASERRVREQLNALAAQLTAYYSASSNREFPNPGTTAMVPLATLAGLPVTAETCTSPTPSQWLNIPITCGSAFVEGGGPVFYKRFRKDHMILVAQTLSTRRWDGANGQPITVVMEMNVGNF
ncbi:MAG: hypothetical protein IBX50_06005 [Marinospirillum sp.]|uniref:hypothetical protein n=1 Tax=Marinospirillum sp. TaxID=2183934 RepID=UPI0019DC6540|nr:hypothetical protein [Marinospirillum sp.]MBE0506260.1 hypothetical protein [Marinospirillum sp.]